jgi:hypothetical protein
VFKLFLNKLTISVPIAGDRLPFSKKAIDSQIQPNRFRGNMCAKAKWIPEGTLPCPDARMEAIGNEIDGFQKYH